MTEYTGASTRSRTVYTPESQLRHPGHLLRLMLHDLKASKELAWRLMMRDVKAQYRQSYFGILWAFVPTVVTAIGLTVAKNTGIINLGDTPLPYPLYVVFSMSIWQVFVDAWNGPLQAISQSQSLLAKINFPREALILSKIEENLLNFGIRLILVAALFLWFQVPVGWTVILAPIALIHLIALGTGLGLCLVPVGALYQDISKAIPLLTSPLFFLTPVIYSPPETGLFSILVKLNPITPLLVTARELTTGAALSQGTGFWLASGLAITLFLIGWLLYRLSMPFIIERMSS